MSRFTLSQIVPRLHRSDVDRSAMAESVPDGATDWLHPRAATMLPAELLQGGEAVILLVKPSPWYILLESLRFLVILGVVLAGVLWLNAHGYAGMGRRDPVLMGVGLAGLRLVWQFTEWLSRVYVLTDRRVIRVKGVIRVQVFETPLQRIQHTTTTFSLRERLFGLGTISFATAGTGIEEASWEMIAEPLETHQIVVRTLNRYR